MTYSDKDLIRKRWMRYIIFIVSLICLVVGVRHWDYFHNWKGILVSLWGVTMFYFLIIAYENLLEEKK
jgi:cytosine/uracil/thiamine/allantoin permease